MNQQPAYIIGINTKSLKIAVPAKIIGVVIIEIEDIPLRPYFHVMWRDKKEDWIPIDDIANYKIMSLDETVQYKKIYEKKCGMEWRR